VRNPGSANKMPRASEARDPWFPIRGLSPPARAGTLAVAARLPGRSCDPPLVIAPLRLTRTNVPEMRMECNELLARGMGPSFGTNHNGQGAYRRN